MSGGRSRADAIPFQIVPSEAAELTNVPFTQGLCLPKGQLIQNDSWQVVGPNQIAWDAQTEVLDRWSDGSVRWLLASFVAAQVPADVVCCHLQPQASATSVSATTIRFNQQSAAYELRIQSAESTQPTEDTIRVQPELKDHEGNLLEIVSDDIQQEHCGPIRQVFVASAHLQSAPFVTLQLRFEVWPQIGHIEIQTRIRNSRRAIHKGGLWDLGDPGSFLFTELAIRIDREGSASEQTLWKSSQNGTVRTLSSYEHVAITQLGSGGPAWACTNHTMADGRSSCVERGYRVASPAGPLSGHRSEPVVCVTGPDGSLTAAVPEFWQQFPGQISATGNTISVGLFPEISRQTYELQGGEQKTQSVWISTQTGDAQLRQLDWVYSPPSAIQSAKWIQSSKVFQWFPGELSPTIYPNTVIENGDTGRLAGYLYEATTGQHSFDARRQTIDEYGWRNFGDIPADHEQTHYSGSNTIVSHYNNQFDLILGGILNMAASGDAKWRQFFDPMARHVMDIDIYHTDEDRSAFSGGLFWHTDHYVDAHTATHRTYSRINAEGRDFYGGGPACEHNYTTGLLYYYYLTGNPEAKESVLTLANWVIAMDDGSRTIWGLLDSGPTGIASNTVLDDFHGPGRGVGNSINALLDAWLLTLDDRYRTKADELIRRAVHPTQNCDELHLIDAEGHWSYTVCLTALGRYLAVKLEADQQDEMYAYVRDTLVNYGRWMAGHERPSLSEPDKLQYPTEAWAAQDFRKANVLRIAAACCDDPELEAAMRRKADELNDAAWRDLYSFDDRHLTARCFSIVMTEGLRDVFHRTCTPEYMPPASVAYPQTNWTMFVPQKQRIKQLAKQPVQLLTAAVRACNPSRWLNTWDALRRQFQ